jgi:hypothetical protein
MAGEVPVPRQHAALNQLIPTITSHWSDFAADYRANKNQY